MKSICIGTDGIAESPKSRFFKVFDATFVRVASGLPYSVLCAQGDRYQKIKGLLKEVFSTYLSTNPAILDIPDSVDRLA